MCRVKTDSRTHQDNFASRRKSITLILCFSGSWQWASVVIKRRNVLLCQSEEPRQPARALWSLMRISGGLLGAGMESCPPCLSMCGNLIYVFFVQRKERLVHFTTLRKALKCTGLL